MSLPLDTIVDISKYSNIKTITSLIRCNKILHSRIKPILESKIDEHSNIAIEQWLKQLRRKPLADECSGYTKYLYRDAQYIRERLELCYSNVLEDDENRDEILDNHPDSCKYYIRPFDASDGRYVSDSIKVMIKYIDLKPNGCIAVSYYKVFNKAISLKDFLRFMYRYNIGFEPI